MLSRLKNKLSVVYNKSGFWLFSKFTLFQFLFNAQKDGANVWLI